MVQIVDVTHSIERRESASPSETNSKGRWSFRGFKDSLTFLLMKIGQVSNSLFGQVITISLGEMAGARLGSQAISDICHHLFVPLTLIASGAVIYYHTTRQTNQLAKVVLLTSAVAMTALVLTPSEQFLDEQNLAALGWGTVGRWVGAIAGGYTGQILVGGVPQKEYPLSMAKCIGVTEFTNAILAPPPVSLMGYPLGLARGMLLTSLGLCAYYSPQCIEILQAIAKNEKDKTLLTRLFTQFLEERCNGQQSADVARKISDQIMAPLEEISKYLVEKLQTENCRNLISALIGNGIEFFLNPKTTPTFTLRSFEGYVKILKTLDIQKAHDEFEYAFFEDPQAQSQKKQQLIDAIQDKIKVLYDSQTPIEQMIDFVLKPLLNDKKAQELAAIVIQKIQEAEIDFIGFSLLGQSQARLIEELLSIHIQNYVIFALSHYCKFEKALSPLEEKHILLDCNHAVFSLYFNHIVPVFIARSIEAMTGSTIHTIFKVKEGVHAIFKKKSQKSYIQKDLLVLPSYFDRLDGNHATHASMAETAGLLSAEEEEEELAIELTPLSQSMLISRYFDNLDNGCERQEPIKAEPEQEASDDHGKNEVNNSLEMDIPFEKQTIGSVLNMNYF